jgi:hypothetical protein
MAAASPKADIPRKSRRELCPVIAASFESKVSLRELDLVLHCVNKLSVPVDLYQARLQPFRLQPGRNTPGKEVGFSR